MDIAHVILIVKFVTGLLLVIGGAAVTGVFLWLCRTRARRLLSAIALLGIVAGIHAWLALAHERRFCRETAEMYADWAARARKRAQEDRAIAAERARIAAAEPERAYLARSVAYRDRAAVAPERAAASYDEAAAYWERKRSMSESPTWWGFDAVATSATILIVLAGGGIVVLNLKRWREALMLEPPVP
jgi:hypothetical protein